MKLRFLILTSILISFSYGEADTKKTVGNVTYTTSRDDLGENITLVEVHESEHSSSVFFRCNSDGPAIFFLSEYPFTQGLDSITTKWKFDRFPSVQSMSLGMTNTRTGLFIPGDLLASFLNQAKNSNSLVVSMLISPEMNMRTTFKYNFKNFSLFTGYLKCIK